MGGEIRAAGFLARLDEDHAARVRRTGGLHRFDGPECGEGRVAVVGAPAAVQSVVLQHGLPRTEVAPPALHLGLLVEMAVQQHRRDVLESDRCRDLADDHRGQAIESVDRNCQPGDGSLAAPRRDEVDGAVDVAVGRPVGVEAGRERGDRDVVGEHRYETCPELVGAVVDDREVEGTHRTSMVGPLTRSRCPITPRPLGLNSPAMSTSALSRTPCPAWSESTARATSRCRDGSNASARGVCPGQVAQRSRCAGDRGRSRVVDTVAGRRGRGRRSRPGRCCGRSARTFGRWRSGGGARRRR